VICLSLSISISIMSRRLKQYERKVVKGQTKVVAKRYEPSLRKEGNSSKRPAPSPEPQPSSSKAPRIGSPLPFDDSADFMDADFDSPPSPDMEKGKAGKVAYFHMNVWHCSHSFCLESKRHDEGLASLSG
jgi:hypothetical protein